MKDKTPSPAKIILLCADNDQLYALCEDGSAWVLDTLDINVAEWKELPCIPET